MIVNTSIPGRTVRVELSNHFGSQKLKIGAAHVALHDTGSAIVPGSGRVLTFSGLAAATIPAGASLFNSVLDGISRLSRDPLVQTAAVAEDFDIE